MKKETSKKLQSKTPEEIRMDAIERVKAILAFKHGKEEDIITDMILRDPEEVIRMAAENDRRLRNVLFIDREPGTIFEEIPAEERFNYYKKLTREQKEMLTAYKRNQFEKENDFDDFLGGTVEERYIDICVNDCEYFEINKKDILFIKTASQFVRSILLGEECNIMADTYAVANLFDDNAVETALKEEYASLDASAQELSALLNILSLMGYLHFALQKGLEKIGGIIDHTNEITGTSMPENSVAISSTCFNRIVKVMELNPFQASNTDGWIAFNSDIILNRLKEYSYYDGEKVYLTPSSLFGCNFMLILFTQMIITRLEIF